MTQRVRVLLLGDRDSLEFTEAIADLDRDADLMLVGPGEEPAALAREHQPHAVVIAQSRPGRFSAEQLAQVQAAAPMARWISLLGGWCEGEGRSGDPYPGAVRVYWHQWRHRAPRELASLAAHRPTAWGLPRTATDIDRFLLAQESLLPEGNGLVVVSASSLLTFEVLTDACSAAGYSTVWLSDRNPTRQQGATAGLCDFASGEDRDFERLRSIAAAIAPAPVLALMNFPRRHDRQRAIDCGACEVVSKPFLVEDLAAALASRARPA